MLGLMSHCLLKSDHSGKDKLSVLLLTSATAAGGALKSKLTRTTVRVKVLVLRVRICNTPVPERSDQNGYVDVMTTDVLSDK